MEFQRLSLLLDRPNLLVSRNVTTPKVGRSFLIRPGKRPSGEEAARVLRLVIKRIRKRWPRVKILVRGYSHC